MIASTRTVWVASLVVLAAVAVSRPVWAESRNQIRAITFSEDSGTTKVRISGSEVATFTVYKLERPSRVVLDVARAELSDELRGHEAGVSLAANTWAVGAVGAQPLVDSGSGVRVIVALARPGRYDVKIDGKDLLVLVTARDAAPAGGNDAETKKAQAAAADAQRASAIARADAEQSQRALAVAERSKTDAERSRLAAEQSKAAAEKAQKEAEREASLAKTSATSAQKEAERLRAVAAEQAARAQRAEQQAAAAAAGDRKRDEAAAAARKEAQRAQAEAEAARVAAVAAQKEMERTRAAAEEAKRSGQLELERERKALAALRATVEADRQEVSAQRAQLAKDNSDAERLRGEAKAAREEAARVRSEAEAAQRAVAQARKEAEAAHKAANAERKEVSSLRAAAQAKLDDAEKKLDDANAKLGAANAQLASLDQKTAAARRLQEEAQATAQKAAAQKAAAEKAELAASAAQKAAEAEVARAVAAAEKSKSAAASAAQADKSSAASERERLAREAAAAEARLAEVRQKAAAAEEDRARAEKAAALAKAELEAKQRSLTSLEAQRQGTEQKIRDAATRQARAEAAALSAGERKQRAEAEALSAERTKQANEAAAKQAEAQRVAAETASRATEEQRLAALAASRAAETQRAAAEDALAELAERRRQADRAAAALEERRAAAAKAEAKQAKAAEADRQSSDRASKSERERAAALATRLAAERQRAEDELRERTAAVKEQSKEVDRLKQAAAAARADAEREENRRTQLAERRAAEERELERLRKQVASAAVAPAPAPVLASPVAPRNPSATLVAMAPTRAAAPRPIAPPKAAPSPAAPAPAAKAVATVTDISFHADDLEPRIDIAIRGDAEVRQGPITDRRVELIIDDAQLADKLERKLDVTRFGGALRSISSFRDRKVSGRIHLVVDLATPVTPTLSRRGDIVGWRFAASPVAQPARRAPRTQNIPPPVIGGFGSGASTPIAQQTVTQVNNRRRKVYRGPTVELDFKEAPIHDLLRLLSDVGKVNIVVPDEVDAKVTVRMKRVPWDQALEVILASKGLWYRQEGNLIRVAQRKALDEEDEAEAARRAAAVQAEAPRPDVITLNYASAEALRTKLAPLLSPKGKIEVDERTNALLVNDVRANREEIRALALQLDTQTPQISIEARIVEARSTFTREIGVQWGGRATAGPDGGNATGLLFPSSIGLAGGAEDDATIRSGVATPSDFAVNLPAAVGSGAGGALGISLGSIGGNYNINLRLSALEGTGSVRIVSAPKITVLNNTEAKISQGVSIPIQVLSAQGTNTVFVPADLALTVKPYVSLRDCAIAMELNVTKNEPDFVNTGARGDPTILRKEARTTLLVNDGETSVLGGIYTRNAGLAYAKVPFFGDLPVLGWLFKNRSENDSRTEVLVFITPKITNKAFLRCQNEPK
jgi:type IV pilus assembly protein PilQ